METMTTNTCGEGMEYESVDRAKLWRGGFAWDQLGARTCQLPEKGAGNVKQQGIYVSRVAAPPLTSPLVNGEILAALSRSIMKKDLTRKGPGE
jgi:hypothetical protein